MALVQTDGMFAFFGLDVSVDSLQGKAFVWVVALAFGILLGALIGSAQGFIVAYVGVPSFIVTLGGFLVWRGAIFRMGDKQGQTLGPLESTFQLLGGGAKGSLGEWRSWLLALLACAAIVLSIYLARRRRMRYSLAPRPMWADVGLCVVGCAAVIAGVGFVANNYPSPITGKATGIAYPVVILIGVTLLMSYLARRRRFGRYVYAYGGNPEAAELGGINTRRTVMLTFVLMGVLCAVSAAVQSARLNGAITNLGDTERARRHRGCGHRWRLVRRRHRDDPGCGAGCRRHAVAALRHGAAEDRLAVAGHRGRHRAGDGRGHRLPAPPGSPVVGDRRPHHRLGPVGGDHPVGPDLVEPDLVEEST